MILKIKIYTIKQKITTFIPNKTYDIKQHITVSNIKISSFVE